MTLQAFLLRFALIYVAASVAAGVLGALLLPVVGTSVGTGLAIGGLGASVMLACWFWVRRNRRWFERAEAWRAWAGMLGATLAWQLVTILVVEQAFRGDGGFSLGAAPLALALAVTTALHAVGIGAFMALTKRQLVKHLLAEPVAPIH